MQREKVKVIYMNKNLPYKQIAVSSVFAIIYLYMQQLNSIPYLWNTFPIPLLPGMIVENATFSALGEPMDTVYQVKIVFSHQHAPIHHTNRFNLIKVRY